MSWDGGSGLPAAVLFGPPAAGKSTQARRIAERFRLERVSTGSLIRAEILAGSALGRRLEADIAAGRYAPDEVAAELVARRLAAVEGARGAVFEGYPRTAPQAEQALKLFERLGFRVVAIKLRIAYNELQQRILGRRECANCSAVYNVDLNPPERSETCDACGAGLVARPEDRVEVISERLRVYEQQTLPVCEVFRRRGLRIHPVEGGGAPEQVSARLFALVEAS